MMTPEEIHAMAVAIATAHSEDHPSQFHAREYWRLTIYGPGAGALASRLNEQLMAQGFDHSLRFQCRSAAKEGQYFYDAGAWFINDLLLFFFGAVHPPFIDTTAEEYVIRWMRGGTFTDCYPVSDS